MSRKERPAISGRIGKTCWWLVKWGFLAAVIAVAVGAPYFYREVDRRLRSEIAMLLAARYPHLKVAFRSVELVQESEREGILLRGVSLAEPDGDCWTALVECEEVFLSCPTDWVHLAQKDVPIHRILIRRPTFYLRRTAEGTWNYSKLQPKGQLGDQKPELLVEEGTVVLSVAGDGESRPILLRDLQAAVTPSTPELDVATGKKENSAQRAEIRRVRMSLSGQGLQNLVVEGWVDVAEGDYAFQGKATHWDLTPEWQEVLPIPGTEKQRQFGTFQGQIDISFQISHRSSPEEPIRWEVSGRVTNGRFHGGRLPYPLTDIWAVFRADADGIQVDQLFARHGASTLRVSYRRNGYEENSPMHLEAEIRRLELQREWLDLLGIAPSLARHWDLYRPSGQAHIYLKLDYDGQHWFPEAVVECVDVSFLYAKFPYRLDHGRGRLELRNDALEVQLTAFSENLPVRVAAEILHPLTQPSGWIEIQGQGLPMDQKFFDALSEPTRRFLTPLHPQGTLDVVYRWRRERPEEAGHRQILLQLNRAAICYDRFPYPIRNLRGTLEFVDGRWEFWGLTGSNGSAQIRGYGHFIPLEEPDSPDPIRAEARPAENVLGHMASYSPVRPTRDWQNPPPVFRSIFGSAQDGVPPMELYLQMTADQVPLDEELRDALPPSAQRLWNQLRPAGRVNLPELEIRYRTGQPAAQVRFTAQPIAERASIEPVPFPYRMEKLQGTIFFAQDQVFWQGFRAEHEGVRISADVFGRFQSDGAWQLEMENLFVDRLPLDRELTKALPEQLKKVFNVLNPEGALALQGRWALAQPAETSTGQTSQWDFTVNLVGVHLHPGISLENIHGGVRLTGDYTGQEYRCWGELDLDSLMYLGHQITRIQGPFWVDSQYAIFGPDAEARRRSLLVPQEQGNAQAAQERSGRLITGQWFGGPATGQGWIRLGPEVEFALRAMVSGADLSRIAQEHLPGIRDLRGKVYGWAYLHGHGKNLHTLTGQGALHLREADIYQLPVMIALLKVLNLRRPDTNAFSACDLEYRIAGPHIYLDRIVFQGDAVSLHGAGETNFQGEVHLALSPMLGREDRKSLVLKQLLGGAGQEFMVIRVTGSLQDPKTEKQVFPTLNQALQNLAGSRLGQGAGPVAQRLPTPIRRLPQTAAGNFGLPNGLESPIQPQMPTESAPSGLLP